jgi:transketolase
MEMNKNLIKRMRDAFVEKIYKKMKTDNRIFFLSDDLGAPILDRLKEDFKDRFINVGIAEQNLINVATGLALEGYTVYAYGIAPFFLRAYEQIRINLALSAQVREINVNMIGVGSGVSYDVSGPTHHCVEDLIAMRALPNIQVFSPSDWFITEKFVDYSLQKKIPKYIRLDGKPLPRIYDKNTSFNWDDGFTEIEKSEDICILSTGFPTHMSLKIIKRLQEMDKNIGLIDVFMLKPLNEKSLFNIIKNYKHLITIEEAFVGKGGLDTVISNILNDNNSKILLKRFGFKDEYLFKFGGREFLYKQNSLDEDHIVKTILEIKLGG